MNIWILQTGEPLHIDGENARPMRAMNLSNALVQAGHRVVLWSSAFHHQEKRHRSHTAKSIKVSDKLEIRLIPSRGYRCNIGLSRLVDHAQLALNLKKILKQVGALPDVAFIGFPPIETAAVLTSWLKKRGVPTLLDVKDQWPSLFLDAVPAPLRPLGRMALSPYFHLARSAMQNATGISVMADGYLDWALGIAGRKRTARDGVFPLTSPSGQISALQLEEARQWWDGQGISNDGRSRVCFVGTFMSVFDWKPVQEAAKMALNGTTPCEFVICGDGGSSGELRAMMAGLPNVHFPGWIDRPKIEALAERCQAALAPYLNIENFTRNLPNKILDALSLGLPILSPLKGEVAKLINEYGVGMRYGTDSGISLYDCIQTLIENKDLQKKMSQKARALYEERFSFEMVYGGMVKHLENMAHKPGLQKYVFFTSDSNTNIPSLALPQGYYLETWAPKIISIAPKGLLTPTFFAWWVFHWLKIFKNSEYRILLIYAESGQLAHYTVVLPAHYRFPFMGPRDIQIGPVDTYSAYRKKGLAAYTINEAINRYMNTGRKLWYVARKENEPSIKLIEKFNFFSNAGEGVRMLRYRTKLLAQYLITKPNFDFRTSISEGKLLIKENMLKRLFDLTSASIGLFLTSPLLLTVAAWIKLDSPGPVFYRPWRGGLYGKPFRIFKFRSMVVNADKIGGPTTSGDDPRVTRSGRFIRRFKLDELSQLINVVAGDMSLVGPRPEVVEKVEKFSEEEKKTLELRPGITDWASIWDSDEGGVLEDALDPDAVYEEVIRPTKMKLQLEYLKHHSFWVDLKIIFCTLYRLLNSEFMPKELEGYPTFGELRREAMKVIERQKTEAGQEQSAKGEEE